MMQFNNQSSPEAEMMEQDEYGAEEMQESPDADYGEEQSALMEDD